MKHFICLIFLIGCLAGILLGESLKITKVGEWGTGHYYDFVIEGNYAYCAAVNGGLDIIDISSPSRLNPVAKLKTPGEAQRVCKSGNHVYVTIERKGFIIVDVSNPAQPTRVGHFFDSNSISSMTAIGQYLYITGDKKLYIMDISTPRKPINVGLVESESGMSVISIIGSYAYLKGSSKLFIYDISNATKPKLRGSYKYAEPTPYYEHTASCMADNWIYLLGSEGLRVIDVSNPGRPILAASSDQLRLAVGDRITAKGNYMYIGRGSPTYDYNVVSRINVVDISDPSNPVVIGSTPGNYGWCYCPHVYDGFLYAINQYSGLQVFDISIPTAPVLKGYYLTATDMRGIDVREPYAYTVDWYAGLIILDISNPSQPVWVGQLKTPGRASAVYVEGNYAYVADYDNGLLVVDITEPTAPKLEKLVDFSEWGNYAHDVFVKDNYAYVACGRNALKIVDVSIPSTASLVGTQGTKGWESAVFVTGNYAYVTAESYCLDKGGWDCYDGSFSIVDISTPSDSNLTAEYQSIPINRSTDVYVKHNYAYVAVDMHGLKIFDISSPFSISLIGEYSSSDDAVRGVFVDGNYAYTADGKKFLQVIDISDPRSPVLAGGYSAPARGSDALVSQQRIYVTDSENGNLFILQSRASPPSDPQVNLSRYHLNFSIDKSGLGTGAQIILVNTSGGDLEWKASPDQDWLDCTPISAVNSGELFVFVDPSDLPVGTYTGSIPVSSPRASNSPQTVTVTLNVHTSGHTTKPFGIFATPLDGTVVSGSIPVTGWALDDIEVQNVQVFREENSSLVYIGDAVFVEDARPDVEQAYPAYPYNYRAGWGYMLLTNFLPNGGNGTFNIHAIATDIEGNQVTLGTKTIICDNANAVKPFGAIDTPTQGGIAAGSEYVNFGWALTPSPNSIPIDGSTITVWVDGVPLGSPVYNRFRQDINTLFPGYDNSSGAGGYFYLDTTQYENSVHTISWSVTDDAGNTDGIGSRYFSIQNTSQSAGSTAHSAGRKAQRVSFKTPDISKIPVDYSQPLRVKKGYNRDVGPQTFYPDENGQITIEIKELERVEIQLSNSHWTGFQVIGSQLRTLPIGSFLDTETGIFSWTPGPGHYGLYTLIFIKKRMVSPGEGKKYHIQIKILPRFGGR